MIRYCEQCFKSVENTGHACNSQKNISQQHNRNVYSNDLPRTPLRLETQIDRIEALLARIVGLLEAKP